MPGALEESVAAGPVCSVLVPIYNNGPELETCLRSLLSQDPRPEVLVFDNGSGPATREILSGFGGRIVVVSSSANVGFAAACNRLARVARGEFLVFCNPDVTVPPRALARLVECARSDPSVAAWGPLVLDEEGRPVASSRRFPTFRTDLFGAFGLDRLFRHSSFFNSLRYADGRDLQGPAPDVDQLIGAFFFVPRTAWDRVGPFDERFFVFYEEVDWCLRASRLGLPRRLAREVTVTHLGGVSTSGDLEARMALTWRSQRRFMQKYGRDRHLFGWRLSCFLWSLTRALALLPSGLPDVRSRFATLRHAYGKAARDTDSG